MQPETEPRPFTIDAAPWSDWARRLVSVGLIVIVVTGLAFAGPIYGQVLLALTVCLFLFLPIRVVMRRLKLPYSRATLLVFVLYLLLLLLLFLFLTAPVVTFITNLIETIETLIRNTYVFLQTYQSGDAVIYGPAGNILFDLDSIFQPLANMVQNQRYEDLVGVVPVLMQIILTGVSFVGSLVGVAYNLFFIHLLALLFLFELPNLNNWLINNLGPASKRQIGVLLRRFDDTWTAYLWGAAVVSVIGAVLTWALLTLLGIPNALGITAVTTLVLQIPFFGPALGTAVCFLAALGSGSTTLDISPLLLGLLAGLLFFAIRGFFVGNFIYPRIVGKSVEVPGVIVLIALSFFGSLAGILGMFLSPVLAAALRDLGLFVFAKLNGREPFPTEETPGFMMTNRLKRPPAPDDSSL